MAETKKPEATAPVAPQTAAKPAAAKPKTVESAIAKKFTLWQWLVMVLIALLTVAVVWGSIVPGFGFRKDVGTILKQLGNVETATNKATAAVGVVDKNVDGVKKEFGEVKVAFYDHMKELHAKKHASGKGNASVSHVAYVPPPTTSPPATTAAEQALAACNGRPVISRGGAWVCADPEPQAKAPAVPSALTPEQVADVCQGPVAKQNGKWVCARVAQVVAEPEPPLYGFHDTKSKYSVPWGSVGIGCLAGAAVTKGALLPACLKSAAATGAGDVVGYVAGGYVAGGKYRDEIRAAGQVIGGGFAVKSIYDRRPRVQPLSSGTGGPVYINP